MNMTRLMRRTNKTGKKILGRPNLEMHPPTMSTIRRPGIQQKWLRTHRRMGELRVTQKFRAVPCLDVGSQRSWIADPRRRVLFMERVGSVELWR